MMPRPPLLPLFLALTLAVSAGCRSATLPDDGAGTFVGTWDGAVWVGDANAVLHADTLYVWARRGTSNPYAYQEILQLRVPFAGPGAYAADGGGTRLMKIVGGDAGYFPAAEGTIDIATWEPSARRLSGELSLTAPHDGMVWRVEGSFDVRVGTNVDAVPWRSR